MLNKTDINGATEAPGDPDIFTTEERQVARAKDILDLLAPYARTVDIYGT